MIDKIKRSRILVKNKLQLKYAAVILIAMLVTAVTVGADFYIRLYGFIGDFLKDLPGRNIEQLMTNMNRLMYAKIIVLILIAIAISLYVSHKFAGPLVHLEKNIEKIAKGDLTHKIYLRSGDELKYLANYFNYMTGRLKDLVADDRRVIKEVVRQLEAIKGKVIDIEAKNEVEDISAKLEQVTQKWKIDES